MSQESDVPLSPGAPRGIGWHRRADLLVFGAWLVLFVVLLVQHVPWRDEHQAWLVATRTDGWGEFFRGVRYERHPPLHYLMLRALSWLPFVDPSSLVAARTLTACFTIATVALLIFGFRTAPAWLRFGVPFGLVVILEYGVISRTYAIGMFLLLASVYLGQRERLTLSRVCLLLAAGTHLYFTMIAGVLFALSVRDETRSWRARLPSALLVGCGFLGWLILQLPPEGSSFARPEGGLQAQLRSIPVYLSHGLTGLDSLDVTAPFAWNGNPWTPMLSLGPLALLGLAARRGFPLGRFALIAAGPLLVMSFGYQPALRHAGVLFVAMVLVALLELPQRRPAWPLAVFVGLMCLGTTRLLIDWQPVWGRPDADFSGSAELVAAIRPELRSRDAVLVVERESIYFPVMTDLGIDVFDTTRDAPLAYPYFDERTDVWPELDGWCAAKGGLQNAFPELTVYLGLGQDQVPPASCGPTTPVFRSTRRVYGDEAYSVHRAQDGIAG